MKNIFKSKKEVVAAVLAVAIFATFTIFNPFELIFSQFRKDDNLSNCVTSLSEAKDTLKFMYSLSGVPEDKMDTALTEAVLDTCKCMIAAAGKNDVKAFIENEDNSPVMQKCSEDVTKATIDKYSTGTSEDI